MKYQWLKDLAERFSSNRREITSLLILIPFIFIVLYSHQVYNYLFIKEDRRVYQKISVQMLDNEKPKVRTPLKKGINPNYLKVKDWVRLNFSEEISERIVNYRLRRGRFNSIEDLHKIYEIDTLLLGELEQYFVYTDKNKSASKRMANVATTSFSKLRKKERRELNLQTFDPNTVNKDALTEMGLSSYFIISLVNYRAKGGVFYKKEDLLKLYGVDSSLFQLVKNYIVIKKEKRTVKKKVLVNLNTADLEQLKQVKGIGDARVQKIMEYKSRLGGSFYGKEQLKEVFGFDSLLYQSISAQVFVDKGDLKKISINNATYEQLATHPYLSYKQARWIVKYREQHGKYENIEDLLKIKTIKLKDIENILPYLSY